MKKRFKTIIIAIITSMVLCAIPLHAHAAYAENQIMPCYTNAENYIASFSIADDIATVSFKYYGNDSTFTEAEITVKIQKRFLLVFWNDVDIGYTNNEWNATSTDLNGIFRNTFEVNGTGYYRALITVKFYGTTGDVDTIELTKEYQYK